MMEWRSILAKCSTISIDAALRTTYHAATDSASTETASMNCWDSVVLVCWSVILWRSGLTSRKKRNSYARHGHCARLACPARREDALFRLLGVERYALCAYEKLRISKRTSYLTPHWLDAWTSPQLLGSAEWAKLCIWSSQVRLWGRAEELLVERLYFHSSLQSESNPWLPCPSTAYSTWLCTWGTEPSSENHSSFAFSKLWRPVFGLPNI